MPHPVGFSETEIDIITSAAAPIDPRHRSEFIEAVLAALTPHAVLGEGLVHRTCRTLQRQFLSSPTPQQLSGSKYGRGAA